MTTGFPDLLWEFAGEVRLRKFFCAAQAPVSGPITFVSERKRENTRELYSGVKKTKNDTENREH